MTSTTAALDDVHSTASAHHDAGWAAQALRAGWRVQRAAWADLVLVLQPGDDKQIIQSCLNYPAGGAWVWQPSNSDIMARDYRKVP